MHLHVQNKRVDLDLDLVRHKGLVSCLIKKHIYTLVSQGNAFIVAIPAKRKQSQFAGRHLKYLGVQSLPLSRILMSYAELPLFIKNAYPNIFRSLKGIINDTCISIGLLNCHLRIHFPLCLTRFLFIPSG